MRTQKRLGLKVKIRIASYFMCCFIGLSLFACAENEKGCLDPNASNYDVTADKNCCCTYPSFSVEINSVYGSDTVPFMLGNTYKSDAGTAFKFLELDLILYAERLTDDMDEPYGIIEELDYQYMLDNSKQSGTIPDDFIAFNPNSFSYTLGSFNQSGSFKSFDITWGLTEELRGICRDDLDDGQPLKENKFYDAAANQVVSLSLRMIPDTLSKMDTLEILSAVHPTIANMNGSLSLKPGVSFVTLTNFDVKKWISSIDFKNESEENIVKLLTENFSGAWSLKN